MKPWQMTKEEYAKTVTDHDSNGQWLNHIEVSHRMVVNRRMHPLFVKEAIEDGRDVPAHVLEEYNRNKKGI